MHSNSHTYQLLMASQLWVCPQQVTVPPVLEELEHVPLDTVQVIEFPPSQVVEHATDADVALPP
jgi:hypothetical protein